MAQRIYQLRHTRGIAAPRARFLLGTNAATRR